MEPKTIVLHNKFCEQCGSVFKNESSVLKDENYRLFCTVSCFETYYYRKVRFDFYKAEVSYTS